jgi:hypothetical protein
MFEPGVNRFGLLNWMIWFTLPHCVAICCLLCGLVSCHKVVSGVSEILMTLADLFCVGVELCCDPTNILIIMAWVCNFACILTYIFFISDKKSAIDCSEYVVAEIAVTDVVPLL